MQPIILAAISAIGGALASGFVFKLLGASKVPQEAGDAIQNLPDLGALATPTTSAAVHAAEVLGHYIEVAAKKQLTGAALQAFCAFLATGPSGTQVLAYAESNFGAGFVTDIEASIPAVLKDEMAILGDHLPAVIGQFVGKLLPGIGIDHAQQQLDAAGAAGALAAKAAQASAGQNAATAAEALK